MAPPVRMADDFDSGTRAAACGGTTTVIPFAAQAKGGSLRAAVEDYHRRAEGKAVIDYAFHLIVTDPSPQALGQVLGVGHGLDPGRVHRLHGFDDAKEAIDLSEHALAFVGLELQPGQIGDPGNILRGQGHGLKRVVKDVFFRPKRGCCAAVLPGDRVLSCVWCRSLRRL